MLFDAADPTHDLSSLVPYSGPWQKSLQLAVHFTQPFKSGSLPVGVNAGNKARRGRSSNSGHLLAITGHEYRGLWPILCVEPGESTIRCSVRKYDGEEWVQNPYDLAVPNSEAETPNVCVTEPLGVAITTRSPAVAWIPPPLTFHARMTVFAVDDIDTVRQTFRANLFLEMRLRGLSSMDDRDLVKHVLQAYDFNAAMVEVLNVVEEISPPEKWESFGTNHEDDQIFDYCFKVCLGPLS